MIKDLSDQQKDWYILELWESAYKYEEEEGRKVSSTVFARDSEASEF